MKQAIPLLFCAAVLALPLPGAGLTAQGCAGSDCAASGQRAAAAEATTSSEASQAGHHSAAPYQVGDRLTTDYMYLYAPERFGLEPDETYYRADGYLFRVDRDTRQVLEVIGLMATLLQ